jgi:predicted ATPase
MSTRCPSSTQVGVVSDRTHAAENARRKHAYPETVAVLRKSVDLLNAQPDTVERKQQELALLVTLGVPLLMTKGYAAPEVEQTYARARQLCQEVDESPQLLPALAGLFRFYFVRAEFSTAQEFAEQVLRLAGQTADSTLFLIAHGMRAVLATSRSEFVTAREHFDKGLSLYDAQQHRFMVSIYGDDPGVICLSLRALSLWFLGYPDRALHSAYEGLALAQNLELPYNLAFALDIAAWIHCYRGECQAAQTCLDSLFPLVNEQGFEFFAAESAILQGWVMAEQGREAEGLAQMRPGVVAYHDTGAEMSRPTHLGLLAKTYGKVGQAEAGLATLVDGLTVVNRTGERCIEAELYRLKGELRLQHLKIKNVKLQMKERRGKKQRAKADLGAAALLRQLSERGCGGRHSAGGGRDKRAARHRAHDAGPVRALLPGDLSGPALEPGGAEPC